MTSYLYVDDNIDDCVIFSLMFDSKQGVIVKYVHSANDALQKIKDKKYDLIFCDIMMPGKSGFAFARQLENEHINIPIILVSGIPLFSQDANDKEIAKNVIGFILKPVTYQNVRVIINGEQNGKALS